MRRSIHTKNGSLFLSLVVFMLMSPASPLHAADLVSVNSAGTGSGNKDSFTCCGLDVITPDGRYVFFSSEASNLVANDTNGNIQDLFVRDFQTGVTTLVSVNSAGTGSGNGESFQPAFTPDGRYVAFASDASDLVPNDTNGTARDIFVRDLQTGTTTLVSVNAVGTGSGNGSSTWPRISADGRYVAFVSLATDLVVTNDTNGGFDLFVRDLQTGTTTLVSVNAAGTGTGNQGSDQQAWTMSADGRYVAFTSNSSDLVTNDTNGFVPDVFVRDLQTGTTTLISVNAAGTGSGNADSFHPAITADGRYVAFVSYAADLVANVINNGHISKVFVRNLQLATTTLASDAAATGPPGITPDGRYVVYGGLASDLVANVFVLDLQTGTTTLVTVNAAGTGSGNGSSNLEYAHVITPDGRYVVFESYASNLVSNDTNANGRNTFVRDLKSGATTLLSVNAAGTGSGNGASAFPVITADGRYAVFESLASDLVAIDTNGAFQNIYRVLISNTPTGNTVTVLPAVGTEVTFSSVSSPGNTTVTTAGSGPAAPTGFSLGDPPTYYDVKTTATFSGAVTVCLTYDPARYADISGLRLLHYASNVWVDVTTSTNTTSHVMCGQVGSLSPFGVVQRVYTFTGFFQPVDNLPTFNVVKAGSAVPVKFSLHGNQGLDIFATGYPGVSGVITCGSSSLEDVIEETVVAGSSSLTYDASSDQYVYVWKTSTAWATSCRQLVVKLKNGTEHRANFNFKK